MKVGDQVRGKYFPGEKPLTHVDQMSVIVQITPSYEQAYSIGLVSTDERPWRIPRTYDALTGEGDIRSRDPIVDSVWDPRPEPTSMDAES